MLEVLLPAILGNVFPQVAALVGVVEAVVTTTNPTGAEHIVRIVERYLAEYRSLLQEVTSRMALMIDRYVRYEQTFEQGDILFGFGITLDSR